MAYISHRKLVLVCGAKLPCFPAVCKLWAGSGTAPTGPMARRSHAQESIHPDRPVRPRPPARPPLRAPARAARPPARRRRDRRGRPLRHGPPLAPITIPRPPLHPGRGRPADARGHAALRLELRAGRVLRQRQPGPAPVLPGLPREGPRRHHADPLGQHHRAGDAPGAQRPGGPAGPVAEGDPRPQAPGRHHGGRDEHPLPHRQRPGRRRRPRRLAAAAAGQGRPGRGRLRAEGGVPQPGPVRPQAVAAVAPDRPPQER